MPVEPEGDETDGDRQMTSPTDPGDAAGGAERERSPEEVVDLVYRAVLRRAPDESGLRAYSDMVRAGVSEADLIKLLMASPEFGSGVLLPLADPDARSGLASAPPDSGVPGPSVPQAERVADAASAAPAPIAVAPRVLLETMDFRSLVAFYTREIAFQLTQSTWCSF